MSDAANPERIIVCGGRHFSDYALLCCTLDALRPEMVITGGCGGADQLAQRWADANGVPCAVVRANWARHNQAAGPIRNREMVRLLRPDLVIAFAGGRGTANMIQHARDAGVAVILVTEEVADAR